jgi:hypothetical protein
MALNGPHQSLPGQLMFNAQYLVRLQFPLGYNFLTLLRYNSATLKQVAFNNLMQNMAVSCNCQICNCQMCNCQTHVTVKCVTVQSTTILAICVTAHSTTTTAVSMHCVQW